MHRTISTCLFKKSHFLLLFKLIQNTVMTNAVVLVTPMPGPERCSSYLAASFTTCLSYPQQDA